MEGLLKEIRVNPDFFSAPPHPVTASLCDQTEPQINPEMSGGQRDSPDRTGAE